MTQETVNAIEKIERKISRLHHTLEQEIGASTMDLVKELVACELEIERLKHNN